MTKEMQTVQVPDDCRAIALCGGPYSNFGAVAAFLAETATISHRFCLGDIGGFGPHPNWTLEQLRSAQVQCLQGNYDYAIGHGERDCGCGYTDPQDQCFAQISYDYTFAHTAVTHRAWLRTLPPLIRLVWRDRAVLLCHGSPEVVNNFVWESTTGDRWIEDCLARYDVVGICATHTGIPWMRQVDGGFWFNVGVLGRPAHEGSPHVYYGRLELGTGDRAVSPVLVPLGYDVEAVAEQMAAVGLPPEFQDSLRSGVWTTCAEILPPTEKVVRPRLGLAIAR